MMRDWFFTNRLFSARCLLVKEQFNTSTIDTKNRKLIRLVEDKINRKVSNVRKAWNYFTNFTVRCSDALCASIITKHRESDSFLNHRSMPTKTENVQITCCENIFYWKRSLDFRIKHDNRTNEFIIRITLDSYFESTILSLDRQRRYTIRFSHK